MDNNHVEIEDKKKTVPAKPPKGYIVVSPGKVEGEIAYEWVPNINAALLKLFELRARGIENVKTYQEVELKVTAQ